MPEERDGRGRLSSIEQLPEEAEPDITWANEQLVEVGEPPMWIRRYHEDWVELQLAHSEENEVRGAYNAAEYLAPRRAMLQDWADFLDSIGGKPQNIAVLRAA